MARGRHGARLRVSSRQQQDRDARDHLVKSAIRLEDWSEPVGPAWVGEEFATNQLPDDTDPDEGVVQQ